MRKNVSIFILLLLFTFLFTFLLTPFPASAQVVDTILGGPLVPCGGMDKNNNPQPDCNLCQLKTLAQNVLNFLVAFTVVAATVMFAWAGILYVTAGPNPGQIEKAHKIFWNVFIGLVIVLAAWLIVDTIMKVLAGDDTEAKFGPWNQILCTTPPPEPGAGGPPGTPGTPSEPPPEEGGSPIGELPAIGPGSFCIPYAEFKQCYTSIRDCLDTAYTQERICTDRDSNFQIGSWVNGNIVGCDACEPLFATIPNKGPGEACSSDTCSITDPVNTKLANLKNNIENCNCSIQTKGSWWVTETFPPTVQHRNPCHYNGTCVDANFKFAEPNGTEVMGFIQRAEQSGLVAIYEVNNADEKQQLRENGLGEEYLSHVCVYDVGSSHFSVYDPDQASYNLCN